ncbi:MAG: sugar phosphate isomerase/epimerase [Theionarchaea archaeon]|nr:sugar phosphate isomerase/epimerase [Theionarchaea archaeon]MBU7038686.1 sugar phosphate isomerase/epimerase [Theionarchaea archaeon]
MKTAAVSSVYKSRDLTAACDAILDIGYDCVEVMAYPPHVDLSQTSRVQEVLSPYEGHISGFGIYENLCDLRENYRIKAVEETITCIELCNRTGGEFVVCQTGIAPSFLRNEASSAFEKSLDRILPAAHDFQVCLALENAPSTLLATVEETSSFLDHHTDPAICLTVDPVNFFAAQCSPSDAERLVRRTVNLHLKNVASGREAPVSQGEVDFHRVLSFPWTSVFTAEYEETAMTEEFLRDARLFLG